MIQDGRTGVGATYAGGQPPNKIDGKVIQDHSPEVVHVQKVQSTNRSPRCNELSTPDNGPEERTSFLASVFRPGRISETYNG